MLEQVTLVGRPSWSELREGDRTVLVAERTRMERVAEHLGGKGSFSGCEM